MNNHITYYQRVEDTTQRDIWMVFTSAPPVSHELGIAWPALSLRRPAWTTTPCQWFSDFDLPHFRAITRDQVASYYPDAIAWIDRLPAMLNPPPEQEGIAPFVCVSLGFAYIVPNTPDQIRRASALLLNDFNDAVHRWDLAHRVTVAPALGATGADVSSIFTEGDES